MFTFPQIIAVISNKIVYTIMAPARRIRYVCLVAASCITLAFASSTVPDARSDPVLAGGDAAVPNEPPPSIRSAHGADGGRRRGLAYPAHGQTHRQMCTVSFSVYVCMPSVPFCTGVAGSSSMPGRGCQTVPLASSPKLKENHTD